MLTVALLGYVSLMSVTPGPNNLMLAASGVNFGFRRTLPHVFGISSGHGTQVVLVSLFLSWVLALMASWRLPLALLACAYLLRLCWQIWHAGPVQSRQAGRRAMGFWAAAAFQWVNPKAWVMVINTAVLFLPANAGPSQALLLGVLCALINLPCIVLWAAAGSLLREFLAQPHWRRLFNGVMATSLLWVTLLLLRDELSAAGVW